MDFSNNAFAINGRRHRGAFHGAERETCDWEAMELNSEDECFGLESIVDDGKNDLKNVRENLRISQETVDSSENTTSSDKLQADFIDN